MMIRQNVTMYQKRQVCVASRTETHAIRTLDDQHEFILLRHDKGAARNVYYLNRFY
jgi:hypothetical protein